jgi:hypothetical protein
VLSVSNGAVFYCQHLLLLACCRWPSQCRKVESCKGHVCLEPTTAAAAATTT